MVEKKPKELGKSKEKTGKMEKGANGYSPFFSFIFLVILFLFFFSLFSFFFGDNGLLTKVMMLVGNSLK